MLTPAFSSPYSVAMQVEVATLEEKVQQLIALCVSLRNDNQLLRQQLLAADRKNKQLSAQMNEAAQRLDVLLAHLPADTQ